MTAIGQRRDRLVSARITDPTGQPRQDLPVWFHAPAGLPAVVAMTDAAGVFRAALEADVTYRVPVQNAVTVDGQLIAAGTVIEVTPPAGEGPVPLAEVGIRMVDASPPALLDRAAVLEGVLGGLMDQLATTSLSLDLSELRSRLAVMAGRTPLTDAGTTTGGALTDLANGGDS